MSDQQDRSRCPGCRQEGKYWRSGGKPPYWEYPCGVVKFDRDPDVIPPSTTLSCLCERLAQHDATIAQQAAEIERLKARHTDLHRRCQAAESTITQHEYYQCGIREGERREQKYGDAHWQRIASKHGMKNVALLAENKRLRESATVLERLEIWKRVNKAWRVNIVCCANSEEVWFVTLHSPFGIPQPTIETTGHHGLLAAVAAALDEADKGGG